MPFLIVNLLFFLAKGTGLDTVDLDLSLCGKLFLDEEICDALTVVTSKDDDAVPILRLYDATVAVIFLL